MKKRYILLILLVVLTVIFVVKMSSAPTIVEPVVSPVSETMPKPDEPVLAAPATKDDLIVVESPRPGQEVSNPISFTGRARGNWFFEGSFPITVTDWDGKIIGEGYATAQGEWMTTEYVPFVATVSYDLPSDVPYKRGFLILHKDNPSGESRFDNAVELSIQFK